MCGLFLALRSLALLAVSVLGFVAASSVDAPFDRDSLRPDAFDWLGLKSKKTLDWVACYTDLQCARIEVPLNYSEPRGRKGSIAVVRLPAAVSADSPEYRGPVLFNPGGPGGSGVDLMVVASKMLSILVGPQFDVVSFDPRGIARSTPRVSFFDADAERAFWGTNFDVLNATADALPRAWSRAYLSGVLAAEHDDGILVHINTENTARDMLRIVEAYGMEKIQYWGLSYGTVLGATFATLFPDRVERLILDGVVDAENYYATLWSNNLKDIDKTLYTFFEECVIAGSTACPFYAPTPEAISQNLTALFDQLRERPIPIRTPISYGVLDYSRLLYTVFESLYSPYGLWPPLAKGLADLAAGDGTALYSILEAPFFNCACGEGPFIGAVQDAQRAILCTDGEEVRGSVDQSRRYFEELRQDSVFAEIWGSIHIGCTNWPKQNKTHFQGPSGGNTSHPILWIGNTADPVTPLRSAHKMAKSFPGSVVLTQDSPGHCSIAAPSMCTFLHVRRYLTEGTLPVEGTVCPTTQRPFPQAVPDIVQGGAQTVLMEQLSEVDANLDVSVLGALTQLSTSYLVPRLGLGLRSRN
ncbi:hypothetical protein HGRIS_009021 [Hohenbuehelia grisea]|uniref:Alpha/beta-hydrolase n=1 Tax=Hohenbuehelia grisea TaxID=104357 RepID=A0ABR3IZX4_9AGAR